ncbi:MAG TPA: Gfo/Idh/MocA family oxidoreductase [Baekduia sp.]|nr:Gfo/Idh/MocA family oxidoreductase [Baekduia sp.]
MVRTVVLGAGAPVHRHVRALGAHADRCTLTGVHDADPAAAAELAGAFGLPVLDGLDAALDGADAAIVGGRLEDRPALTRGALERGLDVLVEPPLAPAPDMAHGLLSAIVRAPRRPVALVAYDDAYDPAVLQLRELVADQPLLGVDVERLDPAETGPTPELDVVHDLMLQDLQLVLALCGQPIAATQAAGRRVRRGGPVDHAQALLVLEDDVLVSLLASRAGAARVRRVTVSTTQARVTADLDARVVEAVRTTAAGAGRHEAVAQRVHVVPQDPTAVQAEAFLRCVERRTSPESSIGMAIAAQEAAVAILKRIELVAHRPAMRRGPQAA